MVDEEQDDFSVLHDQHERMKADQIKGIEQASKAYTNDSLLVLAKVFGYEQHFLQAKGSEAAFTKGSDGSDDVRG